METDRGRQLLVRRAAAKRYIWSCRTSWQQWSCSRGAEDILVSRFVYADLVQGVVREIERVLRDVVGE